MKPLESELAVARECALAASAVIRRHALGDRESWEKAEDSPVTHADLEANRTILAGIRESFPDDGILSEEKGDSDARFRSERVWIVDPLDGTKEFVARIPEFAVSVALTIRGEPVVGVVVQPLADECFSGARGQGAHLNGDRLKISSASVLEKSTMLSSRTEMSRGQVDRYREWVRELRPVGSVALKLAWIAAGRGDLWVSLAPKSEWDVCAGDLLVREAGGVFMTLRGGPRRYNQRDVLLQPPMAAGPKGLVNTFLERVEC